MQSPYERFPDGRLKVRAIRDLDGIARFGMGGYFRGVVPPAINNVMVTGIDVPVRIGNTTVMP